MHIFGENLAREFQRGNGLLATHRWELLQKYFQTVASFKMLEKDSSRHARSYEHRGAAQNIRVAMYHQISCKCGHCPVLQLNDTPISLQPMRRKPRSSAGFSTRTQGW